MKRMQEEAAAEKGKSEAALKESERRAIADIERLQAEVAADRQQLVQQQQQQLQRLQADIESLKVPPPPPPLSQSPHSPPPPPPPLPQSAVSDTETKRDAAIGRASQSKEQALAAHDYVRRVVEAVVPSMLAVAGVGVKEGGVQMVPAIDESLVQR